MPAAAAPGEPLFLIESIKRASSSGGVGGPGGVD